MGTFGIDLGTTYSCIAKLNKNGNPEVIRNNVDGTETLASAVYFESPDNVIVGETAKEYIETDGHRVVQFAKRFIGKNDAPDYTFDDHAYTPVEISGYILKGLKKMAEEQGECVQDVVITVPAYFGFEEKAATREAGEKLAGLNVLSLIHEPTAAALSYCSREFSDEKTIMVYDLGGGTFDVTLIKLSKIVDEEGNETPKIEVLGTGGNDRLGGKDWDDLLFEHVLQLVCDDNGLEAEDLELETRQQIRSNVEKTKMRLTVSPKAKIKVRVDGAMTQVEITKEEFEEMTAHLVKKTMDYVETLVKDCGNPDIDTVLLVGGSTYMPMIRDAVNERFPEIVQIEDPDRAVAKGAAILANMKMPEPMPEQVDDNLDKPTEGKEKPSAPYTPLNTGNGPFIYDITSRSFGPGVMDKGKYVIDNLIKIGDNMPVEETRRYFVPADNLPGILLIAFENVSKQDHVQPNVDPDGNSVDCNPEDQVKVLGDLELTLLPNTPKGTAIQVTFTVDDAGVTVKALNESTGEVIDAHIAFESDQDYSNSKVLVTDPELE